MTEEIALQVVGGAMSVGNNMLQMVVDQYNICRDRELKLQLAERNERLQKELEEEKGRLEVRIEEMRLAQDRARGMADRELQIRLSHENRQLQWELAVFNEYARRKNALWEIGKRFQAENFPLYIRKENYYDFIDFNHSPSVKIVFSPPVIGGENGTGHMLEGIDVLMTARLTKFLHKIFDVEEEGASLYEYLGNAWRDKKFRGQSAYRYIFNEFSSEPFIIVDCEAVRGYLTFQLCYWMPGFQEYQVLQVLDGFPVDGILYESMRRRTEKWESAKFPQMKNAGMSPAEMKELYPKEFRNAFLLQKEREIVDASAKEVGLEYQYDAKDYDAVIEVVSLLVQVFIGVLVDLYQMSTGRLHCPCFLEYLREVTALLPERDGLKDEVEHIAVKLYLGFADPDKKERPQTLLEQEYCQDSTAIIISRLILADILYQTEDREDAEKYFGSAWKSWCHLLGLSEKGLGHVLAKQNIKEAVLEEFRNDPDIGKVLQKFREYRQFPYAQKHKEIVDMFINWYDDDWENMPHLYL